MNLLSDQLFPSNNIDFESEVIESESPHNIIKEEDKNDINLSETKMDIEKEDNQKINIKKSTIELYDEKMNDLTPEKTIFDENNENYRPISAAVKKIKKPNISCSGIKCENCEKTNDFCKCRIVKIKRRVNEQMNTFCKKDDLSIEETTNIDFSKEQNEFDQQETQNTLEILPENVEMDTNQPQEKSPIINLAGCIFDISELMKKKKPVIKSEENHENEKICKKYSVLQKPDENRWESVILCQPLNITSVQNIQECPENPFECDYKKKNDDENIDGNQSIEEDLKSDKNSYKNTDLSNSKIRSSKFIDNKRHFNVIHKKRQYNNISKTSFLSQKELEIIKNKKELEKQKIEEILFVEQENNYQKILDEEIELTKKREYQKAFENEPNQNLLMFITSQNSNEKHAQKISKEEFPLEIQNLFQKFRLFEEYLVNLESKPYFLMDLLSKKSLEKVNREDILKIKHIMGEKLLINWTINQALRDYDWKISAYMTKIGLFLDARGNFHSLSELKSIRENMFLTNCSFQLKTIFWSENEKHVNNIDPLEIINMCKAFLSSCHERLTQYEMPSKPIIEENKVL